MNRVWRSSSVLLLASLLAGPALAYVRTTTRSSNPPCPGTVAKPLYWNTVTVPYAMDAAGSPDVTAGDTAFDAIRKSFQAWEDVTCSYIAFLDKGVQANTVVGFENGGANTNVVKWIESGWAQSSRAIAVTLTTYDCNSGQIFDADITLNGQSFNFTTQPRGGLSAADVQNTVTHEVGHVIGFDHDADPESTMYADAPLGEIKKRSLTQADIDGVCLVYPLGKEPKPGGCAAAGEGASGGGGVPVGLALLALAWARRGRQLAPGRGRR